MCLSAQCNIKVDLGGKFTAELCALIGSIDNMPSSLHDSLQGTRETLVMKVPTAQS
jgi:hypothetical protein